MDPEAQFSTEEQNAIKLVNLPDEEEIQDDDSDEWILAPCRFPPKVLTAQTASGQNVFGVRHEDHYVWFPEPALTGSTAAVAQRLASRGISLPNSRVARILESVAGENEFPRHNLLDHVGWNRGYYALPDRSWFEPSDAEPTVAIFPGQAGKVEAAGTLSDWKRLVAYPLINQTVPAFAIMMMFAPPVRPLTDCLGNFGIEIVGDAGIGKSTVLQLAASVLGPLTFGGSRGYVETYQTEMGMLEETVALHHDLPLVVDAPELLFAGETPAKRGALFKSYMSAFSATTPAKASENAFARPIPRTMFLSASREPLAELAGQAFDIGPVVADRLFTIRLAPDRISGVFDTIPKDYADGNDFAACLIEGANQNHGQAAREFLSQLVKERTRDEAGLRRKIKRLMDRFRREANVNRNDGAAVRTADVFGLVFAAARLAQRYRVLPQRYRCGPTALACYRLYLSAGIPQPFSERLMELAESADVVDLTADARAISPAALQKALAVIISGREHRELLIICKKIRKVFPDWSTLKSQGGLRSARARPRRDPSSPGAVGGRREQSVSVVATGSRRATRRCGRLCRPRAAAPGAARPASR